MRTTPSVTLWALFLCTSLTAQIDFTANDIVPPHTNDFLYGLNLGYYPPWSDEQLADIAAGNPTQDIDGVNARSIRPWLPDLFLFPWGYDWQVPTFEYSKNLGLRDFTAMVGYPASEHRDPNFYCPWIQSELFSNMYEPIWDNGANGTPVNDQNHYALYIFNVVNTYKDFVKYWEIWNEPDLDFAGKGWLQPGEPGNWWENDPNPCDYALHAPIQHYIRLLRISYEVIKFVDPTAYVATGGIGQPAFLDAVLRYTDNPSDGSVTSEFPRHGGAYFDMLSYHSYPHLDGTLREWSDSIGWFQYFRHSDAAAESMIMRKSWLGAVLEAHGYDGVTFPEKEWMITETNLPRKEFQDFIGSNEAQKNYVIKAFVRAQAADIRQLYVYASSDFTPYDNAQGAYDLMGLYEWIAPHSSAEVQKNDIAVAFKSTSDILFGKTFDPIRTARLEMPQGTHGYGFKDSSDVYTYVLWKTTFEDKNESTAGHYFKPDSLDLGDLTVRYWDWSETGFELDIPPDAIKITATPIFLTEVGTGDLNSNLTENIGAVSNSKLKCYPNPFSDKLEVHFYLENDSEINLELIDSNGKSLLQLIDNQCFEKGNHRINFDNLSLTNGFYSLRMTLDKEVLVRKIIFQKDG